MITGIDIVKTQILVADGASLFDKRIALPPQEEIKHLVMLFNVVLLPKILQMILCQILVRLLLIVQVVVLVYV